MDLTSQQKMFIILDELKKTLYIDPVTHGDPRPDSDIRTWFQRVDAADTATNAPIKPITLIDKPPKTNHTIAPDHAARQGP